MKRLLKLVSLCALVVFSPSLFGQQYSKVTYVHSDPDGTPFAATNRQGNLEWQIDHFPYGKEYENTETERKSDISFAGKPYDQEIGLSYFGGRWYDPDIGRFTSIDPMPVNPEDYRTYNRYAYGFNNPYKYVDPDGNLPFLIPVAIFIAKEIAAEAASRATNGATDFLSVRRLGQQGVKKGAQLIANRGQKKLCFVKGTLVHTDRGLKAIETLRIGDLVLAKDDVQGQTSFKAVSQLYVNEDKPILDIEFKTDAGSVETVGITPEHPVWLIGTGWVEASNLSIGDKVDSLSEGTTVVNSISQRAATETTYNIEVYDFHTYFVGDTGLWVHNMCGEASQGASKGTTPSIKDQAKDIKHTLNGDKNSVTVTSANKKTHFDLDGPAHKGVETPHKQFSHPNTNPQGQTFFNKDSKTVEPMSQQDIRTTRNVLNRRAKAKGGK